jgi:cytochrome c biogenesis protein CcmG/thiol:disulfide interchange protein DsbE
MREVLSRRAVVVMAIAAALATTAGCGQDDPESAVTEAELAAALRDAPPPLERLYAHSGELLDGGVDAFEQRLRTLRGYPVVVNKWASWCGPCRFEFPFFQRLVTRRGTRVAFMAVDSRDNKEDAREFLRKYPVPYPSYFDPKGEVSRSFRGDRVSPETAFYDREGELVYTKPGGYNSLEDLAADVRRYAR